MKYDAIRFAVVLLISSTFGIVFGNFPYFIIAGLLIFIFLQYRELRKVLAWLKKRQITSGPSQYGIINELCREIDFARSRHITREKKLGGFLKRFQKATSALPDAVVVLGLNGEIDWANNKAEEYLGIKWPRDSGLRIANLVRKPEMNRYIKSRSSASHDKGLRLISPVSKHIQLELRVSAYGDRQQLLVARDITSISKTNQMRKDFIANASHELRTPLTVVSGYLESFADDDLCPAEWMAYIRQMRTQTSRMQHLLEDLLQLSSLEGNNDSLETDLVRVPDLLATIVSEARTLSGAMEHQLQLESDPRLYVRGNQSQLYSAFSNLVFNAIQYTPDRGKVYVRWYADTAGAHMEVADNGLGIAAEHIPRLTERFYRIDKGRSRERGGTGLGLAIVKHVLARHDGELHIESKLGEGSVFRCDLPGSSIAQLEPKLKKSLSA